MAVNISSAADIIEDIRAGKMVVLVDAEDRENEGDLVVAADYITPDIINFMAKFGRGLICLTLEESHCKQINLPLMVADNRTRHGTAFTTSIEAATGVSTGISPADRARTVRVAIATNAKPEDISRPGHIFPIMARPGGVLVRAGHTEAGCDLARLAGLTPASVICEIIKDDGEMARLPDLQIFAEVHGLKVGTIEDLIRYRSINETLVDKISSQEISTPYGPFELHAFHDKTVDEVHLALTRGNIKADTPVITRVHEPFSSLDLFEFNSGKHAYSVAEAMRVIATEGTGVIVLLRGKEDAKSLLQRFKPRGDKTQAPRPWDPRLHGIGAQILRSLNVRKMRVLAWPKKMPSLAGFDLEVVEYLPPLAERNLKIA